MNNKDFITLYDECESMIENLKSTKIISQEEYKSFINDLNDCYSNFHVDYSSRQDLNRINCDVDALKITAVAGLKSLHLKLKRKVEKSHQQQQQQ